MPKKRINGVLHHKKGGRWTPVHKKSAKRRSKKGVRRKHA